MAAAVQSTRPWDFSHVLELINTLTPTNSQAKDMPARPSITKHDSMNESSSLPLASPLQHFNAVDEGVSLGDFGKIWQYLGTPLNSPAPKPANASPTLQQRMPEKADYASDGAAYGTPSKRITKGGIKWRDEVNLGDLTDYAPLEDDEDDKKLTKKQRQKKNKKEREQRQAAGAAKATSDIDEPELHTPSFYETPARKASTHVVSAELVGKAQPPSSPVKIPATKLVAVDAANTTKSRQPEKKASTPPQPEPLDFDSLPKSLPKTLPKTPESKHQREFNKRWPVSTPFASTKTSPLLPASVQPTRTASTPYKSADANANPFHKVQQVSETPTKNSRAAIQPKTVRSGEDRNWALLLKIIGDFYEDRASLVSPANSITHSNDPNGIHVFVDASNIFIGFHDQLKRARDIPQHVHVPKVDLSFDALALLMERRRPVAKRCLVGSKPHMAAFDVAHRVGYECNILDKVLKARELTERQKFFQEQEKKWHRRSSGYKNGTSTGGDSAGSGSETGNTGPVYAPERYIEQGVDEIIHLKMMESIVDTETPSTMVLATGDAAQAEYSEGFLKMAERALKKGWRVELVSWSKNISLAYKKAAWQKKWDGRFRIIELDTYAEELLDM
ncbi:hypothetical protein AUEXF2481DRAFT_25604 [Aureobasidium subglaciale EXF-2481]|uniref:NYN domain-containing protein n=1 Tax=Aureobasidium subglaciale (strain EXF-2481) TaxID=1043005 RepID=A0A074YPK4_AURSE|nr:uncharacterized protein AUEXF2481DRAFT_25604 [Aureobasidium subglaciale EXF-2481]KEQ99718.1 hypothetical protein AUEXF2481DRAFT_25604 [Aureobasidium subglaciale EXF-2481]